MFEKMEARYHINIEYDGYLSPFTGNEVKQYTIYTADGCKWTNGLSYRALQKECAKYKEVFLNIYHRIEAIKTGRQCSNCIHRAHPDMFGVEYCIGYEMSCSDWEEIEEARKCTLFEKGTPDCLKRDGSYCPSSSYGDYSPSNPWDAPGMSVRDFI